MEQLAQRYPDDYEAQVFYALGGEARVIRHFQERMPYGLFVPEVREEPLARPVCLLSGALA
jgi:hypothetical protein